MPMPLLIFLMLTIITGCTSDDEKPLAVRDVTTTSARYIPEEHRIRYHREAQVVFEYETVVVYQIDVGACKFVDDLFTKERVQMIKGVYKNHVKYWPKSDTFDQEFLSKYCY